MKRTVFAISILGLIIATTLQGGFLRSINANAQQLAEFKIAQATRKPNKKPAAAKKDAAVETPPVVKEAEAVTHGSAANGGECIRPTKEMRKNHMDLILHKRDATMYQGIRTKDASLKQCISCHAVKGADGNFVKVTDPQHFCRGCHDRVATRIACFDCHASRPEVKDVKESNARLNPHKRLSPFALTQDHKATATALNSYLGAQTNAKK